MLDFRNKSVKEAYLCIRDYKKHLTRQQIKTLVGQIKAGDIDAAMNGLDKILTRKGL